MAGYLSERQRVVPPAPRGGRRAHSDGGDADGGQGRTLAAGIVDPRTRYDGAFFDSQILRERTPWYPRESMVPGGLSWVDWTAAGPVRAELGMRTVPGIREMSGNSQSRAFQDPRNPRQGLHSNPAAGVARTVARYVDPAVPSMTAARTDRLANARYDGQSYSQTTRVQGARR